ncbi:hypothetical protein [Longimicrobium sp.]|uniref:hypothetical protein n=1 Tax=Longimicrobium sp. TaxID=2029185 RepID=UPI003B3BB701
MSDAFEQVRTRMERELGESGFLDTRRWLRDFPQYTAEIQEFVLAGIEQASAPDWAPGEREAYDAAVADGIADALNQARLRAREMKLGARIAAVARREPLPEGSTRNYARALLMAFTVYRLYERIPWVDRVKLYKALYLLEEAVGPGVFTSFEVTAYGLFDLDLRHAEDDAEDRGMRAGWIELDPKKTEDRSDLFLPGPKAAEAVVRAPDYLPDPPLAEEFLDLIAGFDGWTLAAWQTIHAVGKALAERGATIDVESVTAAIRAEEAWQGNKLGFPEFTDDGIEESLQHLARLRLLPGENISYR